MNRTMNRTSFSRRDVLKTLFCSSVAMALNGMATAILVPVILGLIR